MDKRIVNFLGFNCIVQIGAYGNGRMAISLVSKEDHEPVATATVNLPAEPIMGGHVFIKDYSENKGMLDALVSAGIVIFDEHDQHAIDTTGRSDMAWMVKYVPPGQIPKPPKAESIPSPETFLKTLGFKPYINAFPDTHQWKVHDNYMDNEFWIVHDIEILMKIAYTDSTRKDQQAFANLVSNMPNLIACTEILHDIQYVGAEKENLVGLMVRNFLIELGTIKK